MEVNDKTVAILTLRLIANYGGILQNYALQTVLKRLGYEPLTIRYTYKTISRYQPSFFRKCLSFGKRFIKHRFLGCSDSQPYRWWIDNSRFEKQQNELTELAEAERILSKWTHPFIETHINATREYDLPQEFELWKEFPYQRYVVGSDQVWRFPHPVCKKMLFLDFISHRKDIRRVAYAASFGQDFFDSTHFNNTKTSAIVPHLRMFDAISTREDSGVDVCRNVFGIKAQSMPDPTMLLQKSDYVALIHEKYPSIQENTSHVMTYFLDETDIKKEIATFVSNSREKPLNSFILPKPVKENTLSAQSVENWLKGFFEADYVVTDSFHGTVFSIIFNKPFLIIPNNRRGYARFQSVLSKFQLSERMTDDPARVPELLETPIDFSSVNVLLDAEREKAFAFLSTNLD